MRNVILLILFLASLSLHIGCESFSSNERQLYPNGSSELALLMREMFDETEKIKKQLEAGSDISTDASYANMLTVQATEPDKQASELYQVMSADFIRRWEMLKTEHEGITDTYTSMVQSCMNCHSAMCPGPMVRIKHLYLDQSTSDKNQASR